MAVRSLYCYSECFSFRVIFHPMAVYLMGLEMDNFYLLSMGLECPPSHHLTSPDSQHIPTHGKVSYLPFKPQLKTSCLSMAEFGSLSLFLPVPL